jgi:hypothetical protein
LTRSLGLCDSLSPLQRALYLAPLDHAMARSCSRFSAGSGCECTAQNFLVGEVLARHVSGVANQNPHDSIAVRLIAEAHSGEC